MAESKLSWDVSTPSLLQSGTFLNRWDEESSSVHECYFRVDKYGFFLCFREKDKEETCVDLSQVSEVRITNYGSFLKEYKVRDALEYTGPDPLEDRMFTITHGTSLVDVSYIHLCASSIRVAKEWVEGLKPLLYNIKAQNHNVMVNLFKQYVKIGCMLSPSGKLTVRNICRCLNAGKYEQRVLDGLQALDLPHKKTEEIEPDKFTFQNYCDLFIKLCPRLEMDKVFEEMSGGYRPYLSIDQLVNFLNNEQRDPRLNEILFPYYTRASALALIQKYENNKDNLSRDRVGTHAIREFLMSEDNCLMRADRLELYMDMSQPLSHYFINSSHNTYLTGRQFGGKSSVEIYRQCLIAGCRCIELDCWDGPNDEPIITHGKAMCSSILFKDVIEAIKETAFITSEYPLILSFENRCSKGQQKMLAYYCVKILGDLLLTKPLDSYGIEEGKPLPSPNMLKNKIIIKNKKLKPDQIEGNSYTNMTFFNEEIKEMLFREVEGQSEPSDQSSVHQEEEDEILQECCADLKRYCDISIREELPYTTQDLRGILQYCSLMTSEILAEAITESAYCCGQTEEPDHHSSISEEEIIGTFADLLTKQIFIDLDLKTTRNRDLEEKRTHPEFAHNESKQNAKQNASVDSQITVESSERTKKFSHHSHLARSPVEHYHTSVNSEEHCEKETRKICASEMLTKKIEKTSVVKSSSTPERKISHGNNHDSNSKRKHSLSPERKLSGESGCKRGHVIKSVSSPERKVSGVNNGDPVTTNSRYQCHCCKIVCNNSTFYKRCTCDKNQNAKYGSFPIQSGTMDGDNNDLNRTDSDEERDEFVTFKGKREEKVGFGSSLRLNMLKKTNTRSGSITPDDEVDLAGFTSSNYNNYSNTLGNIHPLLSSLVNYIQPVPFVGFEVAEERNLSHQMSSFNESAGFAFLKASPLEFLKYNKRQCSRIYPKGSRVDSSNYMPQVFWNAGCQMVALNFQTSDIPMQMNYGKFEYNAGNGYLLKPDIMCRPDRIFDPFTEFPIDGLVAASLSIKVISGQCLSDRKVNTHVEVDLYGLPTDTVRKKFKTKTIPANGMNPVYKEDPFVFKRIVLPELGMLRIAVMDDSNDRLIGQRIVPLDGVQPGYRYIPLRTDSNQPLPLATLFCHIKIKTYVPEKYSAIVDELSEPIKYQSAAEKRAEQMKVFDIEEDDESFMAVKNDGTLRTSMQKAQSLMSINNSTVNVRFSSSSQTKGRDSVTTLPKSSASLADISNSANSTTGGKKMFQSVDFEELKKEKLYARLMKKQLKDNDNFIKKHVKELGNLQKAHKSQIDKVAAYHDKLKLGAYKSYERAMRKAINDEKVEEIQRSYDQKLEHFQMEIDEKVSVIKDTQSEELGHAESKHVKDQTDLYDNQAAAKCDVLKKLLEGVHDANVKQMLARHDKENGELKKKQAKESVEAKKKSHDNKIKSKEERDRKHRELDQQNVKRFLEDRQRLKKQHLKEIEDLKAHQKDEKDKIDLEYHLITEEHKEKIRLASESTSSSCNETYDSKL